MWKIDLLVILALQLAQLLGRQRYGGRIPTGTARRGGAAFNRWAAKFLLAAALALSHAALLA